MEIRLETQIRNLRQQAKMIRQRKTAGICWDEQRKTTQIKQSIQLKEINQKILAKEGRLRRYRDRINNALKTEHSKTITKILPQFRGRMHEDIPTTR